MFFPRINHYHRAPKKHFESSRVVVLGFTLIILAGAILLALPVSGGQGRSIGFLDAFFTATSAVCVTGLSVIDVSAQLSRFGQFVLLLLIQTGGLGFMAFGVAILLALGRRISLREKRLIQESMNTDQLSSTIILMRKVLLVSLIVESAGMLLLAFRFVPVYGWNDGLFYSLFHAVSAFCNAGFDLFGNSLLSFAGDPLVLMPIMLLIICGGLGFSVLADLVLEKKLSLYTHLVLWSTGILLLSGFALTLFAEWNGALASLPTEDKFLNALFQSVTLRTAGFASIDQSTLSPLSKFISCLYMFIGAAPASTGGGVKVTTFVIVLLMVGAAARGREEPVLGKKRLDKDLLLRATVVLLIGISIVFSVSALLIGLHPELPALDLIYESASAFGTVGLSCNLTPRLGTAARIVEIITMFLGRVGPLTLTLSIARRQSGRNDTIKYPAAKIMIG